MELSLRSYYRVQTDSGKSGNSGKKTLFCEKSGEIRESQGNFYKTRRNQGKVREIYFLFLIYIILNNFDLKKAKKNAEISLIQTCIFVSLFIILNKYIQNMF